MSGGRGGKPNPWLVAAVVTVAAFMEVLDTTIVNVSLPHIAGSLAVSSDNATWTLTTYLVSNGIVLTASSALSRRIGRKRYFLICIAGFTATSFGCGISSSFSELLLFRALQGFFGGGLQPSQQAIILDVFPPEKRAQGFALTAVATILAPVLGPVVGGYLTDEYSWHWIFLINVPIGTLTCFGIMSLVQKTADEDHEKATAPRFDYLGLMFITFALGCMELAADRGEDYDWLGSNFIRLMVLLSVCGYVFGIVYLLRVRDPIVNLRVFADRNFALGWFSIAVMGFVLYASAVLIPQFAQQQLGYTATWAGLVLTPGAVVLVILIPIAGKVLNLVPVKYIIAIGGVALCAALIFSRNLVPRIDFFDLALFRGAQTAALALLFVPISTAAYSTIPKELNSDAAALFSMARNVFGGMGISISTALVIEHQQIRQAHMVEHLTPVDQPYNVLLQQVQQAAISQGFSRQEAMLTAPGQVFQMLREQVAVLSYNDVFLITAVLSLLMTVAGLMMSNVRPKASGGAE